MYRSLGPVISWLLAGGLIAGLAACATTSTRGANGSAAPRAQVTGVLALSDATPVAGAEVRIYCGRVERKAKTDARGRFVLRQLPEGPCQLAVGGTRIVRPVRVGANLMRQDAALRITLPPVHRLTLAWRMPDCGGGADCSGELTLDERVVERRRVGARRLALRRGKLLLDGGAVADASALTPGRKLAPRGKSGIQLEVRSLSAKPWKPLALRGSPRGAELLRLPVRDADGALVPFGKILGRRTILVVAACDALRDDWRLDLRGIAESYRGIGLIARAVAVESCSDPARARGVTFGGPALLWALGASPTNGGPAAGQVLLLDEGGAVLHRVPAPKTRLLEATVDRLERHWPSFAALQRVTLQGGAEVAKAEAERLLAQASAQVKAGKHAAAHRLLRRVLTLVPDSVEAHRQLALTKAELGDLSGALNEVSWWRTSFGDVAAEELMDAVRQRAKVQALR